MLGKEKGRKSEVGRCTYSADAITETCVGSYTYLRTHCNNLCCHATSTYPESTDGKVRLVRATCVTFNSHATIRDGAKNGRML